MDRRAIALDATGGDDDAVIVAPGGSSAKVRSGGISGISDQTWGKRTGRLGPRGPRWHLRRGHLGAGIVGLAGLWALNSSALAPAHSGPPRWIAHRGVHQTFDAHGVDNDTCTAARIHPPTHGLLENTLPSMRAAFDAGADIVELDVHATADGHLIVFHDATLDCRTDGTGRPEDHALADLRGLDLGHGYTADGGRTYPLRGTGRGLLVTLPEVFAALPGRAFLIDLKTNRADDGDRVADALAALPDADRVRQSVYGGPNAVARVTARHPELPSTDRPRMKRCLAEYVALGWTGWIPSACERAWVTVPSDAEPFLWGWPSRFEARMGSVGSRVIAIGPLVDGNTTGVDTPQAVRDVHPEFGGWIWTNRVEVVGPRSMQ